MELAAWLFPPREGLAVFGTRCDLIRLIVFFNIVAVSFAEPCHRLAWLVFFGLLAGVPVFPPHRGIKPAVHKRKRKHKRQAGHRLKLLKLRVRSWANKQAASRQKCLFSCRKIHHRRFKRTHREMKGMRRVQWWQPTHTFCHQAYTPVSLILPGAPLFTPEQPLSSSPESDFCITELRGEKVEELPPRRGEGKNGRMVLT